MGALSDLDLEQVSPLHVCYLQMTWAQIQVERSSESFSCVIPAGVPGSSQVERSGESLACVIPAGDLGSDQDTAVR